LKVYIDVRKVWNPLLYCVVYILGNIYINTYDVPTFNFYFMFCKINFLPSEKIWIINGKLTEWFYFYSISSVSVLTAFNTYLYIFHFFFEDVLVILSLPWKTNVNLIMIWYNGTIKSVTKNERRKKTLIDKINGVK